MMRKFNLCPLVALALGCGGAALRMWQESRYVDGFPPTGDLSSLLLIALSVLAALAAGFIAWRAKGLQAGGLFSGPSKMNGVVLVLSALGYLGAAMFHLAHIARITGFGPDTQVSPIVLLLAAPLELLQAILAVPAVVCLVFLAKDALGGLGRSLGSLTVLLPAACGWVSLIDLYRRSVSDPILWDYVFLLLAIVSLLLAAMARAGFSFADGNPRQAVFFGLFGLFLAPIAFVQAQEMSTRLSLIAMTLYALAALLSLLKDQPMPDPAPETTIEIETEEPSDE
jgi:hypothetical protein